MKMSQHLWPAVFSPLFLLTGCFLGELSGSVGKPLPPYSPPSSAGKNLRRAPKDDDRMRLIAAGAGVLPLPKVPAGRLHVAPTWQTTSPFSVRTG